jgi:N-acyl amino acid synthase of PEP-CTERM/exosortase system
MQPEIFALRYEVYCLECGFLDARMYEDGLESDEYDTGAAHFVAHNIDNELVGSLRLVHPPHSETFPFEERCYELFENIVPPPREKAAEISRLVVRKNYRGRMGASMGGNGRAFAISGPVGVPFQRQYTERRSHSPEILLGLYRQIYQYSLRMGICYWYAAMERSLARALSRLHFAFTPIGMEVDYFGPVTPYMVDLRELERQLSVHSPAVLAWFRGEM